MFKRLRPVRSRSAARPLAARAVAAFRLGACLAVALSWSAAGVGPVAAAGDVGPSYGAIKDGGIVIPGVPEGKIPRRFLRQSVRYSGSHAEGTIVIDPAAHYLYLVEGKGRALRYGVSVGKGAFAWSGTAVVARRAEWPRWTPPKEMVERSPSLKTYDKGLKGGLFNPLGARALYLHQGGRDTLYRIHGTSEWWSIGDDASSGCIRLLNQDVIDLSKRVKLGTPVVVLASKRSGEGWR